MILLGRPEMGGPMGAFPRERPSGRWPGCYWSRAGRVAPGSEDFPEAKGRRDV